MPTRQVCEAWYTRNPSGSLRKGRCRKDFSIVDIALLEHCIETTLTEGTRVMAVLKPLKVVIENYAEGKKSSSVLKTTLRTFPPAAGMFRFRRLLY